MLAGPAQQAQACAGSSSRSHAAGRHARVVSVPGLLGCAVLPLQRLKLGCVGRLDLGLGSLRLPPPLQSRAPASASAQPLRCRVGSVRGRLLACAAHAQHSVYCTGRTGSEPTCWQHWAGQGKAQRARRPELVMRATPALCTPYSSSAALAPGVARPAHAGCCTPAGTGRRVSPEGAHLVCQRVRLPRSRLQLVSELRLAVGACQRHLGVGHLQLRLPRLGARHAPGLHRASCTSAQRREWAAARRQSCLWRRCRCCGWVAQQAAGQPACRLPQGTACTAVAVGSCHRCFLLAQGQS